MIAELAENPPIVWTDIRSLGDPKSGVDTLHDESTRAAWNKLSAQMSELRRVQRGWDGDDGRVPAPALLDSVAEFLRQRREDGSALPVRVIATPDGLIILEWQFPGFVATLEVSNPYEGELFSSRRGYASELRTLTWRSPGLSTYLFDRSGALSPL